MIKKVYGYVDGDPVYYDEIEPTQYEAKADIEPQPQHDVGINAEDEHGNVGKYRAMVFLSGEWISPVWNRSSLDITYAKRITQQFLQGNYANLDEWLGGLLGYLNYFDLNRIELNSQYLVGSLRGYGYSCKYREFKTDWTMADFPHSSEMERIRLNIQALIDGYYEQEVDLPATLEKPDYKDINAIERILLLIYEMIELMTRSFKYCVTFNCGQEVAF